jgi:hypothetical protein
LGAERDTKDKQEKSTQRAKSISEFWFVFYGNQSVQICHQDADTQEGKDTKEYSSKCLEQGLSRRWIDPEIGKLCRIFYEIVKNDRQSSDNYHEQGSTSYDECFDRNSTDFFLRSTCCGSWTSCRSLPWRRSSLRSLILKEWIDHCFLLKLKTI